jgi:Replication-relaxation
MPAKNGFQLVDGDLAYLQHVYELRLATIDHLAALTDRSYKQTADRLAKLEERHYLKCVVRRPHKHVYALGSEGVAALIEEGHAPPELATKRVRVTELKELGINHAILVSDIHVKLILLTRAASFTLSWTEGPSLWDKVTTADGGALSVRPDALFTIGAPGKGRAHYFLEADVGRMAHSRMRIKVRAFNAYFQKQQHLTKHPNMKYFRVATVTKTRGRADALAKEYRAMMDPAWLKAYPVIPFEDLTLAALVPELAQPDT